MNLSESAIAALIVVAVVAYAAYEMGPNEDSGETDQAPGLEDYAYQAISIFESEEMNNNVNAFLSALRVGEGTAGRDGWRTLMGGALFDSFADHPARLGWRGTPLSASMCAGAGFGPGCVSTAAGAFQINKPTWNRVADKLGLTDFTQASQEAAAIELIREKGALSDVAAGRVAAAVSKVRKVWASLPGAGYGQGEVALASFVNHYANAGGSVA
ncbi:glycoside hydrolase family 24 protein [Janthinobacterium sp. ZB1P44]|uniref:glycoside hydrolase family 24 protein n=1 Tax=Janthinobacterium sp. ZB1P44 TaxID=3424192 RepID=UPI003F22B64E